MALCLAYVLSHSVKFALSGEIEHFGHAGGEEAEPTRATHNRSATDCGSKGVSDTIPWQKIVEVH